MIYTDSALQSFRESFDKAKLNYDIAQVDERLVRVIIHKDDISSRFLVLICLTVVVKLMKILVSLKGF